MNRSFYNGVLGIKTHQFGMDVWSNNIANINNFGYRAKRPEFANIFSQTLTSSTPANSQVGLGAYGQTTAMYEKNGNLTDSDNPFDMALAGEGWFGTIDGNAITRYTRRGDFSLDAQGNLVTRSGEFVLGTMGGNISGDNIKADNSVNLSTVQAQTKIQLPKKLSMSASPTTYIDIKANLDSTIKEDFVDLNLQDTNFTTKIDETKKTIQINGDVKDVKGLINPKKDDKIFVTIEDESGLSKQVSTSLKDDLTWSIDDYDISSFDLSKKLKITSSTRTNQEVGNKAHFSTDVISANGKKNTLKFDFIKKVPATATGITWDVVVSIEDEDKKVISTQNGTLVFNAHGALASSTLTNIDNDGSSIKLNLGSIYDKSIPNSGFDGVTANASGTSGVGDIAKDGYLGGDLLRYALGDDGDILAYFDNKKSVPISKVAVFHFQNDQGLTSEGGDYFTQSENSGKAIFYKDKSGKIINSTPIKASKLEMSNVDFATALTEVIVMQKAFTASSKSITTSDQLIQNAINMKK